MSVKDVIKKSILESAMYSQSISTSTIITIFTDLLVAVLAGLVIYMIYKFFFKGVVYSRSFAFTLLGMTVLTCMVTLAISTNIVISLGMVGALSIVRFRTAIKEPLDLLYLFWAITSGIAAGASMYILLLATHLIMILIILIFSGIADGGKNLLIVINYSGNEVYDKILDALDSQKYTVRSSNLRGEDGELTIQVKSKSGKVDYIKDINNISGVTSVTTLEYNGEYHG